MRKSSVRVVLVGLAVALLAVGACGGDDDDNASSTNTTNKTDQTSKNGNGNQNNADAPADPGKFCNNVKAVDQAFAGLADGSTEPKQLNKALANVLKNSPDEIKTDVQASVKSTREALRGGSAGETTAPPTTAAGAPAATWSGTMLPASVTDWMGTNCQGGGGNGGGATTTPTSAA
jgi:hypothetical protein